MAAPEMAAVARSDPGAGRAPWLEWLLVGLLLLLAGSLRMAAPGLAEFKADEARLLSLAYDMAEGKVALRGISSSVGLPNFPASVWLYAIPVTVWPHPYAATLFTGLLSTLAVALTYWFVRRYWGITAALAATLLYTVSPWAVIFSRKVWAQNLLPLFVLGWAVGAALALVERRPRFMWLHLVSLALAVQIHLSAVALIPATLLLLLIFRRAVRWRDVLIGAFLAALTALPFAFYLVRDQALGPLPEGVPGAGSGTGITLDALSDTVTMALGREIHALAGTEAARFLEQVPNLSWVHLLWGLLIGAGVFVLLRDAWRRGTEKPAQAGIVIVLWLFMPILAFLWQWTPVYLHYFIAVLPAPYIAAGVAFSRMIALPGTLWSNGSRRAPRLLAASGWAILMATAIAQVGVLLSLLDFVNSTATPGGYGVPLALKMETVEQVEDLLATTAATEVLIAGEGESVMVDEFPAEWDVLLHDVPHRFVDARHSALFPAQAAVILLDGRLAAGQTTADLYGQMAFAERETALREGEGSYLVLAIPGDARPKQEIPLAPPLLLANWVNLLGYDLPRRHDHETAVWQVHWRTGDNADAADYHFFNHVLGSQGTRISQVDAAAFDPSQWRAGDTVISHFLLPWPETAEGPFAIRVGMYRYPSLENVPLLDEAANPYSDAAQFAVELR